MGGYWSRRPASPADKPTEKTRLQLKQQQDVYARLNMAASEDIPDGKIKNGNSLVFCLVRYL